MMELAEHLFAGGGHGMYLLLALSICVGGVIVEMLALQYRARLARRARAGMGD